MLELAYDAYECKISGDSYAHPSVQQKQTYERYGIEPLTQQS